MLNLQMATSPVLPSMSMLNPMPTQPKQARSSRRSAKRVSWAADNDLCQVRLFLAEDAPQRAGQFAVQDHLQAKKASLLHSIETGVDDLPPGFGRDVPYRQEEPIEEEPCMVPQTAWRTPPRYVIDPLWKVAVGDESKEIPHQFEREVRCLEAVYPRLSAIPLSPAEPKEPHEYDDSETPLIPLIPIEEMEAEDFDKSISMFASESLQSSGNNASGAPQGGSNNTIGPLVNPSSTYSENSNISRVDEPKLKPTSLPNSTIEPDVAAAAKAAFLAITRSNEQGSNIDQDLLIKLLSNPEIIQTLIAQHSKNNNPPIQMGGIQTSLPINNKVNGNGSLQQFQYEANKQNFCKPQFTPVNSGSNKSGAFTTEIPPSHIQASLSPPISEAKVFATSEMGVWPSEGLEFSNSRHQPMSLASASVSLSNGIASSQFIPRSATIPITSASNFVPATTQMMAAGSKWTSSQNEQHYKNLIHQHGGPNKNDHISQNGLQYRKELIQQHGGQQSIERGAQLQSGHVGGQCGMDMNKSKFRKPCFYFNSSKGCRRGSTCIFLHEIDFPKLDESDVPHPKRAKVELEASGRL